MRNAIDPAITLPELTLRGCILGSIITILFTAANIYLGLKVGLTFSTAIPAAVISMALLKFFKNSNILENTMVQSFASAAGTLSTVIFALPGLIMLGFWHKFPYWQIVTLCALGGSLGVMYSIPLRRALVVHSNLPYPEGRAAAAILSVASSKVELENNEQPNLEDKAAKQSGIKDIVIGVLLSSTFAFLSDGLKLFSGSLGFYSKIKSAVFALGLEYSLALFGAGYIVGIRVGIALLLGLFISWGVLVPSLSAMLPLADNMSVTEIASDIWSNQVRMVGVGTIGVAALWSMVALLKPLWLGICSAFEALRQLRTEGKSVILRTERDIPINIVIITSLALIIPFIILFTYFILSAAPSFNIVFGGTLILICTLFVMAFGFFTASVSGYMAGLVGSSNSPISGVGVLAVIFSALMILALFNYESLMLHKALTMALPIFITAVIIAIAAIANDNLQDLKTGQLVGATPWKQQVALILGVIAGSLVIPPILQLVYLAYGFPGAMPHPGMNPMDALSAPQAVLMSTLAQGILAHQLPWGMIALGVSIGLVLLCVDGLILKRLQWPRISVLAVGLAIYLPPEVVTTLICGSVFSWIVSKNRKAKQAQRSLSPPYMRSGVLVASGLIVGESLFGVLLALLIITTGKQEPLVAGLSLPLPTLIGGAIFFVCCLYCYFYLRAGSK